MANIICSLINIGILSAAQPLIPVQLVDDEQMENAVGTAYFTEGLSAFLGLVMSGKLYNSFIVEYHSSILAFLTSSVLFEEST